METMYDNNKEMIGEKLRDALYYFNQPSAFMLTDDKEVCCIMMVLQTRILVHRYSEVEIIDFRRNPNTYEIIDKFEEVVTGLFNNKVENIKVTYTDNDLHSWSCELLDLMEMMLTRIDEITKDVYSSKTLFTDVIRNRINKSIEWVVLLDFIDEGNNIRITTSNAAVSIMITDQDGRCKFQSFWWKKYDAGHKMFGDILTFLRASIVNSPKEISASLISDVNTDRLANVIVPITLQDYAATITDLYSIIRNN